MTIYWGIMVLSVAMAACSQLLLKAAADRPHKNSLSEYLNLRVVTAYLLFSMSAAGSVFVLRHLPLSRVMPVMESAGYVVVALLGFICLRERLHGKQVAGMLLIVVGIILFYIF